MSRRQFFMENKYVTWFDTDLIIRLKDEKNTKLPSKHFLDLRGIDA